MRQHRQMPQHTIAKTSSGHTQNILRTYRQGLCYGNLYCGADGKANAERSDHICLEHYWGSATNGNSQTRHSVSSHGVLAAQSILRLEYD